MNMNCKELSALIASKESINPPFLLDVRTNREFSGGTIEDATNIPLHELSGRLNEIPAERKIVVFCHSGIRSHIAMRILRQKNFSQLYNLTGGIRSYLRGHLGSTVESDG